LLGTIYLVVISLVVATPIGVLAAIFLKEKITGVKTAAVVLATLGAVLVSWPN